MERRTCVVVLYGMPHGSASGAGLNKRKYSGKELITFSGYDAMDYHARWRPTALQIENLILRVMGIPYVNTGENHGKDRTPIPEPSLLPSFR